MLKATCTHCGQSIRVNPLTRIMHRHSAPGSPKVCKGSGAKIR